jgi:hypothetical protein
MNIIYKNLVGKSDGNRTPGRSRHRWENTLKMDIKEMWSRGGFILVRMG